MLFNVNLAEVLMIHLVVRQEIFDDEAGERVQAAAKREQAECEFFGLSRRDEVQVFSASWLKGENLDIILLALSDR